MKTPFEQYRPHPWHGLAVGPKPPDVLHAYIEITPFDTIKWEVDKASGYLMVDRPQASNSLPPTLYGFIPRTYCGERIAQMAGTQEGDGDPLDICILSERPITRADVLLRVRPVGGLLMIDAGQADDKIIAVLDQDPFLNHVKDISHIPELIVNRIRHYFLTYKWNVESKSAPVQIDHVYGEEHAKKVIVASMDDYTSMFTSS